MVKEGMTCRGTEMWRDRQEGGDRYLIEKH